MSICNKNIGNLSWHIGYQSSVRLNNTVRSILGDWDEYYSFVEVIDKLQKLENTLNIKLIPFNEDWAENIKIGKSTWARFQGPEIEVDIFGEDLEENKYEINLANENFKRYFNDYLGLNLNVVGSAHPLVFLKALDKAPLSYFGKVDDQVSQKKDDQDVPTGPKIHSFGIDEQYIQQKNMVLENICQKAIQRESNICWG